MKQGSYSEELRQEIIQQNLQEKKSIKWLSLEYGVSTSTISRWLTVHRNRQSREKHQIQCVLKMEKETVNNED